MYIALVGFPGSKILYLRNGFGYRSDIWEARGSFIASVKRGIDVLAFLRFLEGLHSMEK